MKEHYDVLICGGGTGGLTVAAQLLAEDPDLTLAIIEPSKEHYYQPLWTLVGGGVYEREESVRAEGDFIPSGADWIQDAVSGFDPEHNAVALSDGRRITYDQLVVALGIQIDWNSIPGLRDSVGKPGTGVCSNYSYETVASTWENIRGFKGGKALFTEPVCGVKCGGAPQKIMYLAEDHFRRSGIRDRCEVLFLNGKGSIFSSPHYIPALTDVCNRRGIEVRFQTNLVEIRPGSREAVFRNTQSDDETVIHYEMLHVTPPMGPPDVIKQSALADAGGWVGVDAHSLRHAKFPNVYSLGDCSSLPTSKTGAAIRKQAPTVVANVLAARRGEEPTASYDGYTSCPLVTGYGKLILAEFDYTKEPCESFPFDQRKERYSMYALKAYALPRMYWHGMLKGRM
ncbi:MAG: NAD(P)/FAD-dependent oxidoreductase [Planctomycetes bacterium]|nr:NAD(P)/FAD-dependent oxidoreductase [Planctomycetota bacterium]